MTFNALRKAGWAIWDTQKPYHYKRTRNGTNWAADHQTHGRVTASTQRELIENIAARVAAAKESHS